MLYNGKKMIVEAIKRDAQKEALLDKVSKMISESKSLSIEYKVNELVSKREGKLTLEEATSFAKKVAKVYNEQLKNVDYDLKAKNNLFESFGVKNVKGSKYDKLVDFKTKTINEALIIELTHNQAKTSKVKASNELKESYTVLSKTNSLTRLSKDLKYTGKLSEALSVKEQKDIQKVSQVILQEAKTNFVKATEKAMKLNMLVENKYNMLTEDAVDYDAIERELDKKAGVLTKSSAGGRPTRINFEDKKYLNNITLIYSQSEGFPSELRFNFNVFPTKKFYIDRQDEIGKLNDELPVEIGRVIDNAMAKIMPGAFELETGRCKIRHQLMDKDLQKTGGSTVGKMMFVLLTDEGYQIDVIREDMDQVISQIEAFLISEYSEILTNEYQINNWNDQQKIERKKTEDRTHAYRAGPTGNKKLIKRAEANSELDDYNEYDMFIGNKYYKDDRAGEDDGDDRDEDGN